MKTIIITDKAPSPIGPYSQAVKSDGLIFVSGQIAIDPLTNEVTEEGVEEQTRLIFENIKSILEVADSSLHQILKMTVYLKNLDYFEACNKIFKEYLKSEHPARETVEVSRLPKNVDIEISVIASSK